MSGTLRQHLNNADLWVSLTEHWHKVADDLERFHAPGVTKREQATAVLVARVHAEHYNNLARQALGLSREAKTNG